MPDVIDSFRGPYRFMSNFWPCFFKYGGRKWSSSEHAYQAMKTNNEADREAIWNASNPGSAKKMGRKVNLRPDWEDVKIPLMRDILRAKFTGDRVLGEMLLATGDAELIEGNNWGDKFWGVCDGEGENWLGKLLMELRDEMRRLWEGDAR